MIYVACIFGGYLAGLLTVALLHMARGPKPPSYDDRDWHDL